jgi:hypothetical protein
MIIMIAKITIVLYCKLFCLPLMHIDSGTDRQQHLIIIHVQFLRCSGISVKSSTKIDIVQINVDTNFGIDTDVFRQQDFTFQQLRFILN